METFSSQDDGECTLHETSKVIEIGKNIRLNSLDRISFGAEMKDYEWNGDYMCMKVNGLPRRQE